MKLCYFAALVLAATVGAQMPATLMTPGIAPDAVAVFIGQNQIASAAASGAFSIQGTGSASEAVSGVVLSHTCNADGSFDQVWAISNYDNTGKSGTPAYVCEHGSVNATTYAYNSYTQNTTTCPLTSLSGATLNSLTQQRNSNLGALTMHPYCNAALATSAAVHASALSAPAPAPGPATEFPSPGTVSSNGVDPTTGASSGSTGASDSSSGRR